MEQQQGPTARHFAMIGFIAGLITVVLVYLALR